MWLVDLDDRSIPRAIVDAILAPEERERASRFVFEPDAWHFRLCRAVLRIGLSIYTGIPAARIEIKTAERGKPYLQEAGIHFNVSHCRGVGLLAFTRVGAIGVDVEAVQPDIEDVEIASEHFTTAEAEWVASASSNLERAQRFTRLWTRKEAVLKATGKGIVESLSSFEVFQTSKATVDVFSSGENAGQTSLNVKDISINESIYAAIAGPDCDWEVLLRTVRSTELLDEVGRRLT